MTEYHESFDALPPNVRDVHRALASLKEEIEAVDWYNQRWALCEDAELRAVIAHNRDEEIEHACMTLEWLRRNMAVWNEQLVAHLFKQGPIAHEKAEAPAEPSAGKSAAPPGLGIGSLKGS